jgi:hypothetical protein
MATKKKADLDLDSMRPSIMEESDIEDKTEKSTDEKAADWLLEKIARWRENRDSNYRDRWDEYNRLWRGIWNSSDKERQSERSRFISPAIAQAVESAVAELEEASFGRGKAFVLSIEGGPSPQEVVDMEIALDNDLKRVNARVAMSAALINGAVYGTGIIEMMRVQYIERQPATQADPEDPTQQVYGTTETTRDMIVWHPVQPHNFLIDPEATSIEDALGVAIEEKVSRHIVEQGMAEGIYKAAPIEMAPLGDETKKDKEESTDTGSDPVKLVRYYGLMPRELVFPEDETADILPEDEETTEDAEPETYVEVCVVMMNDQTILKIEESPYMMRERPVVAFQWDIVPNRFWGRGIVEKGYNAQKAHDTILRARFDSLALTVFPMVGVDAARMPKGFKLDIVPGRMIPMNGRPSEIFEPFKIGQVDQNLYQEAPQLERMVFQATGAADISGVSEAVSGEAKAGAVSMALSAVIKRFKRTLMNFHEQMFVPALRKTLHMYMQYSPQRYAALPVVVAPATAMGVIAREYEQQQLISLLQTMKPESQAYTAILSGIIENSNLPNRADITKMVIQSSQPSPEEQQNAEQMRQLAIRKELALITEIESRAGLNLARMEYEKTYKPQIEMVNAMAEARPDQEGDRDFDKLVSIAELAVKEKDIDSNERITAMQMLAKESTDRSAQEVARLKEEIAALRGDISATNKKKRKSRREPDGSIITELVD